MSSCISAIGTANPEYKIKQELILNFMVKAFNLDENNALRLKKIYDHSGIEHRYSVVPDFGNDDFGNDIFFSKNDGFDPFPSTVQRLRLYQEKAINVAVNAVRDCFNEMPDDALAKITHLITVSCTGMYAPGIDIDLVERLGLNRSVERTCINFMGCYGSINGLKAADYICRANENAKVLVVSVELCTLHFQKENTLDNWVANSLFSDGAAAVFVENLKNRSNVNSSLILKNFYSEFVHEAHDEMGWYVGDNGFEMKLTSKVSKLIKKHIKPITERLLNKAGFSFEDINTFAIHPGGKKILEATEIALEITEKANRFAYETLRDYGNMSSATVLYVLKKILQSNPVVEREKILAFAFGPGLTVESMILERA